MKRRRFLASVPAVLLAAGAHAGYPDVRRGRPIEFPRDHGAHPEYRTEWWYITGWVSGPAGEPIGVQITFFRNRPMLQEDNPSAFAPKQLLFAHAAVADPRNGRLVHDQRAARAGFGLAEAAEDTTRVRIDDWSLTLEDGRYLARIVARELELTLAFRPTQAILLQGDRGVSRKGPLPKQASYYYSWPQLDVSGSVRTSGKTTAVTGRAWLDHEWSSEYLAPEAAGWDWTGIDLDDGGAFMAFRMRAKAGGVVWAAATHRDPPGRVRTYGPDAVTFVPLRSWRSPRTGAEYPVAMQVRAGGLQFELQPLMDDQELDARGSTGTVYWEGAVRATEGGKERGRGYLELTGYWRPLKL